MTVSVAPTTGTGMSVDKSRGAAEAGRTSAAAHRAERVETRMPRETRDKTSVGEERVVSSREREGVR